jgi:tryptophan synthase alpha chain
MSSLSEYFKSNSHRKLLSIYFTAGHPTLESTGDIIKSLEKASVDFIEVGMPFSDPMADGEVIQASSEKALRNGMNLDLYFEQLDQIKDRVNIPLISMGYINQVITYGIEKFLEKAKSVGIKALILPDLPIEIYNSQYKDLFDKYDIGNIFLITPQSDVKRIKLIDSISNSFIYMVSSSSTTGKNVDASKMQNDYFQRIYDLNLKNPLIVGFGIRDKQTFDNAVKLSSGAIIGSAFVKAIENDYSFQNINNFVRNIYD